MNHLTPGAPMPASLGRAGDLYRDVREIRLAMEKEVELIKQRETEIREHLIRALSMSKASGGDTGVAGLKYRTQLVNKEHFRFAPADELQPGGWGVFTSWVRKNDRFDMLQKRLNEKAVADFKKETGRIVPGLERIEVPEISVTKI